MRCVDRGKGMARSGRQDPHLIARCVPPPAGTIIVAPTDRAEALLLCAFPARIIVASPDASARAMSGVGALTGASVARRCARALLLRPAARASRRATVRADASDASATRRGPHDGLTRRQKRALSRPHAPTPSERRLAASLLAECSAGEPEPVDVAYVVCSVPREDGEGDRSIVWFAAAPASAPEWDTPVVRLVVGVREAAASASVNPHAWMRNRIFSTRPLGTLDRAFVKVAAGKKATVLTPLVDDEAERVASVVHHQHHHEPSDDDQNDDDDDDDDDDARDGLRDARLDALARYDAAHWAQYAVRRGIRQGREFPEPIPGDGDGNEDGDGNGGEDFSATSLDARHFEWARRVASNRLDAVSENVPRHERDRSVVAMLVHPDGTLLDAAVNTNAENRCLHAEVNLLARWLPGFGAEEAEANGDGDEPPRRLFPRGSRMLVTLQCCRMCAALACAASDAVGGEGLAEVVYDEPDDGRYADATELQARGLERSRRR